MTMNMITMLNECLEISAIAAEDNEYEQFVGTFLYLQFAMNGVKERCDYDGTTE